jgi:RNA polymerase sigma-70 factor (ECF subfamily)
VGIASRAGTARAGAHPTRRNELEPDRTADLDAVERCLAGDREAFGEIVERWQDRIYGAVLRMVRDTELARDLAQETFLKAYTKLSSFRGGAAVGTWLYSIALNQVRSEMRKRSAQKYGSPVSLDAMRGGEADDGPRFEPADHAAGAPEKAATQEDCALLLDELARLDEEHREVLVLREFQDLPYDEIASVLDVPVGTVRSRLHRARGELRERLRGRVL